MDSGLQGERILTNEKPNQRVRKRGEKKVKIRCYGIFRFFKVFTKILEHSIWKYASVDNFYK